MKNLRVNRLTRERQNLQREEPEAERGSTASNRRRAASGIRSIASGRGSMASGRRRAASGRGGAASNRGKNVNNRTMDGRFGEDLAIKHLLQKGYSLVTRNFRIRGGEIDLILQKDGILVFAEVKTRWTGSFGRAEDAITRYKKNKLLRAIAKYLDGQNGFTPWRCDLVAIQFVSPRQAQIRHYKNIFSD